MFEHRSYQRTFPRAPQSVTSLVAALLEPSVAVASYLGVCAWLDEPVARPDLTLCLLVLALTVPGRDRFGDSLLAAAVDLSTSWVGLLAILALAGYATSSLQLFDPEVLLWWAIVTPLAQMLAVGVGQRLTRRAATLRRRGAVVVGAGPLGVKVAKALLDGRDQGIDFVGYFDDRTDERVHSEAAPQRLGSLKDAPDAVRDRGLRHVYITLPLGSQPRIVELIEQLQGTAASIFFVPDAFGISLIQGRLQDINGVPIVGIGEAPLAGIDGLVKRACDLVLASIVLVLLSPLLLAIAIGVKLGSPGPVLLREHRKGLLGEEIVVYAFRSTRMLASGATVGPETGRAVRSTRFGAFLRRSSLDELPRLVNVLQGRMSIVGPRPHATADDEAYRRLIKAYMVPREVKPGLTGWAQVNGHRGEADTVEKMQAGVEYDLEYLRRWSLGLDLQIIARTIAQALHREGAL